MTLPDDRPAVTRVKDIEARAVLGAYDPDVGPTAVRLARMRYALTVGREAAAQARSGQEGEVERKLDDTRADLALANEELFFLRAGAEDDRFTITDLKAALTKAEERVKALEGVLRPFGEAAKHYAHATGSDRVMASRAYIAGPDFPAPIVDVDDLRRAAALLADPTTAGSGAGPKGWSEAIEAAAKVAESYESGPSPSWEHGTPPSEVFDAGVKDAAFGIERGIRALASETGGRDGR